MFDEPRQPASIYHNKYLHRATSWKSVIGHGWSLLDLVATTIKSIRYCITDKTSAYLPAIWIGEISLSLKVILKVGTNTIPSYTLWLIYESKVYVYILLYVTYFWYSHFLHKFQRTCTSFCLQINNVFLFFHMCQIWLQISDRRPLLNIRFPQYLYPIWLLLFKAYSYLQYDICTCGLWSFPKVLSLLLCP